MNRKYLLIKSVEIYVEQQEMSQTHDECPQRNWSSNRHI